MPAPDGVDKISSSTLSVFVGSETVHVCNTITSLAAQSTFTPTPPIARSTNSNTVITTTLSLQSFSPKGNQHYNELDVLNDDYDDYDDEVAHFGDILHPSVEPVYISVNQVDGLH